MCVFDQGFLLVELILDVLVSLCPRTDRMQHRSLQISFVNNFFTICSLKYVLLKIA